MTGPATVVGRGATLAPGLGSHRRSLLVWPRLLDDTAFGLLAAVATTGARLLVFDEPLPAELARGMPPVELISWCDDTVPDSGRSARTDAAPAGPPSAGRWSQLTALHRDCGMVPLPPTARDADDWRHTWLVDGSHRVFAVASVQRIEYAIGPAGARHLVACLATRPSARRRGAAARCLAAVRALVETPCVAITESEPAGRFFEHNGWRRYQTVWFYRWQ